jgi:hypothetical protein
MKKLLAVFVIFGTLSAYNVSADNIGAKKAALDAAEAWLQIVDEGRYSESWEHAAGLFRAAVQPEGWKQSMQAFRKPLGNVTSRTLASQKYSTSLPGAPDGEYVVIQFKTSFANKRSAVETVTPMKDIDGTWRVSGYYIK